MASPASIARHPIHPMLVVFPIGLWVFSFVADLVRVAGGAPLWTDLAFYSMLGGLIGALAVVYVHGVAVGTEREISITTEARAQQRSA